MTPIIDELIYTEGDMLSFYILKVLHFKVPYRGHMFLLNTIGLTVIVRISSRIQSFHTFQEDTVNYSSLLCSLASLGSVVPYINSAIETLQHQSPVSLRHSPSG